MPADACRNWPSTRPSRTRCLRSFQLMLHWKNQELSSSCELRGIYQHSYLTKSTRSKVSKSLTAWHNEYYSVEPLFLRHCMIQIYCNTTEQEIEHRPHQQLAGFRLRTWVSFEIDSGPVKWKTVLYSRPIGFSARC